MLSFLWCACLAFSAGDPADFRFSDEDLRGWSGEGFHVCPTKDKQFANRNYVSSDADTERTGHKALLHCAFTLPADAGTICFSACAVRAPNCPADDKLDVALMAAGKRIIPKEVRTPTGWQSTKTLLPAQNGLPQQYRWRVSGYAGQAVRIVLVDEDERPGSYVCCGGFDFFPAGEFEDREFSRFMVGLAAQHQLAPMTRYDSPHFTALSNAEEGFSETRLKDCELLYSLFYDHFGRKGFPCRPPPTKLMVAIFDTQTGFEAYLGQKTSPLLTGIYHPPSNCMIMYDYGQNQALVSSKRRAEKAGQRIGSYFERQKYLDTVHRQAEQFRQTVSVGTIMHEVAHQLSFNCGMLNREGDMPIWLAEGLACYCEPTVNGSWQGIGEPDQERLGALADALRSGTPLLELRRLVENDRWREAQDSNMLLLAYGQSWALFRMLIEEKPQALQSYLAQIYSRQISDRRLADFCQAFGSDLPRLERHYRDYVQTLVQQFTRPKRQK